jgi:hypothetical protein
MIRIISYFIVIGVFVVIINLLKYNNNFKRLTYESSFMEVISYVCCSFMGCGYIGVHPISKQAKILIILLSLFKFIIIIEVVMYMSTGSENKNVYFAVKDIVENAQKSVNS